MRILFVGGNFDEAHGKPSSIVAKIVAAIINILPDTTIKVANGGNYNELNELLNSTPDYDMVFFGLQMFQMNLKKCAM